jgi:hypothetical protein
MRRVSSVFILGTLLSLAAGSAQALGFGRIGWATTLGQQLSFSAVVRLEGDETFGADCASAEVFSGENRLPNGVVRVNVEPGVSPNERLVRVTTTTLLDEPVVTVSLSVGCGARLSRRFVVFLDPPVINLAQSSPNDAPAPPPRVESETAAASVPAAPAISPGPAASRPSPAPVRQAYRPRPRPRALAVNPAAQNNAAAQRARKPRTDDTEIATAKPTPTGPRLKLEAPAPTVGAKASEPSATLAGAATAAASSAASQAAAVSLTSEQSELIAKERERLQAMEDNLARLRNETLATQKALATLQSRLKGAEAERFSNPLVYALGGMCFFLALAVAFMWRRHSLREASWWASPAAEGAAASASPDVVADAPSPAAPVDVASKLPGKAAVAGPPVLHVAPAAPRVAALDAPDTLPAAPAEPVAVQRRRELSVEELIDLEQQAEFFVVLGQDEAAIDLLMGHLRSTGGGSPLPYLKLLEIYRRRGEREAYDRTRERFNRRFNAYAPDWESDPADGRSLEDYPDIISRLQAIWSKPTEVIELLDASLFRRDLSVDTFDVPAYRELVLLYSVVRDIAEHDGSASVVDLLLPIDRGDDPPIDATLTAPVPFVSVTELSSADRRPTALDLDISAVRAFERPMDVSPSTDFTPGSSFLGLADEAQPSDGTRRKR